MSRLEATTNFRDSEGTDLGKKLITKDYLMSVYPSIGTQLFPPQLWVWGSNASVQLGINDINDKLTPVTTFAGGTNWYRISAGYRFSAAIKTDGTLWTWGLNSNGQLGTNDTITRSTPVTTFAGGTGWSQVSAGMNHCAAIKRSGSLWIWGSDTNRKLGINASVVNRNTPVTTFAGGTNWRQVSCGEAFTAAVKTDGTLWAWGRAIEGQIGGNQTAGDISTPVTTFAGGTNWKQVFCGASSCSAIKTDGTLWVWGDNSNAQLGINASGNKSTPVTTFSGGTNWKQVSFGSGTLAAIKTDGTLWTCGWNARGQLGINIATDRSTPVTTFAGGTNWKQVTMTTNGPAAIKTDGTLWTWGYASYGRLGNNVSSFSSRLTPLTTFAGGTDWKVVSSTPTSSSSHVLAIKST